MKHFNQCFIIFHQEIFMKRIILFGFLLLVGLLANAKGGFSLGATRVIYLSNKNNVTVSVYNTAQNVPLLIQSWVSDKNSNKTVPFVITPPLYRQDNGSNILRIIRTGGNLPNDRESLFYINIKAIAASPTPFRANQDNSEGISSKINIAFVNQIKLFYRPSALQAEAVKAYEKLIFSHQGKILLIKNPTPFYITLKSLFVNNHDLLNIKNNDNKEMLAPFSQEEFYLIEQAKGQVKYTVINDFGGEMPSINKQL